MRIYRLHRAARAVDDYFGAMDAGGRWNPIGTPALYTAEHLSLACLEVLVHLDKTDLPRNYVWSWTELAELPAILPFGDFTHVSGCQAAGNKWLGSVEQLAVRVPSAIIPCEFNILLNPRHQKYRTLFWSRPQPFGFDQRLFVVEPRVL